MLHSQTNCRQVGIRDDVVIFNYTTKSTEWRSCRPRPPSPGPRSSARRPADDGARLPAPGSGRGHPLFYRQAVSSTVQVRSAPHRIVGRFFCTRIALHGQASAEAVTDPLLAGAMGGTACCRSTDSVGGPGPKSGRAQPSLRRTHYNPRHPRGKRRAPMLGRFRCIVTDARLQPPTSLSSSVLRLRAHPNASRAFIKPPTPKKNHHRSSHVSFPEITCVATKRAQRPATHK